MVINFDDFFDDEKLVLFICKVLEIFSLMVEMNNVDCKDCGKLFGVYEGVNIEVENQDDFLGYMIFCFYVFCKICVDDFKRNVSIFMEFGMNSGLCLICNNRVKFEYVEFC